MPPWPCPSDRPCACAGCAAQEAEVALALGRGIAGNDRWPGRSPGSQFAPLRAEIDAARR